MNQNKPDMLLVKPPLVDIPDILTKFKKGDTNVKPWKLQKKACIDPGVGNCWPGDNLSIGYLAAYLDENGCKVETIDAFLLEMTIQEVVNSVLEKQPKILGLSVLQAEAKSAVKLTTLLRNSRYKGHIVMGGYFPTFAYQGLLEGKYGIDSIILGEGEITLLKLWEALVNKKKLKNISGLAYIENDQVINTGPGEWIQDINTLPFPRRDWSHRLAAMGYVNSVSSSRGCDWARCNFCCIHSFAETGCTEYWRGRTSENVISELRTLNGLSPFINFTDENFLPKKIARQRAASFSQAIIKSGLTPTFLMSTRVNSVERESFQDLKKAGLSKVFVGVESGVSRMLKFYSKGFDSRLAIEAVKTLSDLDITVFAGTILFDPYSTIDEIVENYQFFKKIEEIIGYFDLFRYARKLQVYLGTNLHKQMLDGGLLQKGIWNFDYKFLNKRVETLYNSVVEFQESVYPYFEALGNTWEQDPESEKMKSATWDFAKQFHAFFMRAVDTISKRSYSDGSIISGDKELIEIKRIVRITDSINEARL